MRETVNCPFCKKPLDTKLIANFYFCKECEVAVRSESDMPYHEANIYDESWVQSQENEKVHFRKALYIQKQIRKLGGIKTILDVGCATGILVDTLNRNGYTAEGIDSSTDAIKFAKSNRKGSFYLAPIERYESKYKYDLIIASQLIEHLRTPELFLLKVKELLKPLGYLYIETPNIHSWKSGSIWRRRIGGMFYGSDHRTCYTSKSLSNLLRDNGFAIYKVFTKTYPPTIFVEVVTTLHSFLGKSRKARTREEMSRDATLPAKRTIKYLTRSVLSGIYRRVKDSLMVNVLLFIPNKISEVKGRGNQLIVIARNAERVTVAPS